MKQLLHYLIVALVSVGSYWLYMKQLGAIPFLLLSIFFFYKTFDELSGQAKKRREAKKTAPSPAPTGKKAEIIT